MKRSLLIARKDVLTFFLNPGAGIVIAGFFLLATYFFLNYLGNFNLALARAGTNYLGIEKINLNQWVVENYFLTLIVMNVILVPIVISRAIVEEKRQRTWALLLTYPINNIQIVVGKYLGVLIPILLLQGLAGLLPFGLAFIGNPEVALIFSGYLALLLNTLTLIAIALAVSFYCNTTVSASFVSFFILAVLFSLQMVAGTISPSLAAVVDYLSPLSQARVLISGKLSLAAICYHIFIVFFALFILRESLSQARYGQK